MLHEDAVEAHPDEDEQHDDVEVGGPGEGGTRLLHPA